MSKTRKILLAVATLWPLVYMLLFFAVWCWLIVFMFQHMPPPGQAAEKDEIGIEEEAQLRWVLLVFPLHVFTMLWTFVLIVIYIVNLFRNGRVKPEMKALWAVVIFLGNVIAMPVYWYLYVWREPGPARPEVTADVHGPAEDPDIERRRRP